MNRVRDLVMGHFFVSYNYLAHYLVLCVVTMAVYPFLGGWAYLFGFLLAVAKEASDAQRADNYFDVIALAYGVLGQVMAFYIITLFKEIVL